MERSEEESSLVEGKLPCPDQENCGSSDGFCLYDDGHGYCYSCTAYFSPSTLKGMGYDVEVPASDRSRGETKRRPEKVTLSPKDQALLDEATHRALTKWGISQATCRHWDYRTTINSKGEGLHFAVYRDAQGAYLDTKVRNTGKDGNGKDFFWLSGKAPKGALYGAHLLPGRGKKVIIAMGEKDVMSTSQLWACKFPVVGPPQGETNAAKDLAPWIEPLSKFDEVVIVPDMDEVGQKAAKAIARMFKPGQALIATLPCKDLTDTVLERGASVAISAIHNATQFRPDGIVSAEDLWTDALTPIVSGLPWPWKFMTEWTYGRRYGEQYVLGAGTGIGKSDVEAEVVAHTIRPPEDEGCGERCALFNYEAGPVGNLKTVAGKLRDRRFHIPDPEQVLWTLEDLQAARLYMVEKCAKLFINDHQGAVSWAAIKDRLRYLRHSEDVRHGFIDPVAALVAQADDERLALDRMFAEGKELAEELQICLYWCSHLTRPGFGPSHEEGGRVELRHFRGSNAITMWSSFVFGMERNQQSEDEEERAMSTIRVLKDRFTGNSTGQTARLVYNKVTGRQEIPEPVLEGQVEPPALEA